MKLHKIALCFSLGLTIAISEVGLTYSAPAFAQKLVNPGSKNDEWRPFKTVVFNYLMQDLKKNQIQMGRDAKVEVSRLMRNGDWFVASWFIVSRSHPHGWAGQLLFKKEGNRWVNKGSGNYIKDVDTLIGFGVPRKNALVFCCWC